MCKKEARKHLGKLLKRFVLSYSIDKTDSSLSHEKILFFFIVRMFFPVMLVGVCMVTYFDISFYRKYHSTDSYNDKKFLYLFPIPCVAPSFFVVNFVMSVVTAIKIFYWDKVKKCCDKLMSGWNDRGCYHNLKNSWNVLKEHCPILCKNKDRDNNETIPIKKRVEIKITMVHLKVTTIVRMANVVTNVKISIYFLHLIN